MTNDDAEAGEAPRTTRRDGLVVAATALAARLAIVAWAWSAIPPAADGTYYHQIAKRIAEGHGYTWVWPDGVVTYAAHYPVGYPALVAIGYALFGPAPAVAMIVNALIGAAGAYAAFRLVHAGTGGRLPRLSLGAGLAVALHPVLVPYTAAIMTEGTTAALLVIAAAITVRARDDKRPLRFVALTGLIMGLATLVRPQSLVLAPVLGVLAEGGARSFKTSRGLRRALINAAVVLGMTLLVCAPWTLRNCARMDKCALVSVNGGWNLAIGAQTTSGGWSEIVVPDACKAVFQEAAKDDCFGREAVKVIAAHPWAWALRMPAKLRVTFDYFGAAPWYLHTANASYFSYRAKVALGAVETLVSRLLLAAALIAILRAPTRRPSLSWAKRGTVAIGLVSCVLVPGTVGYLALALAIVSATVDDALCETGDELSALLPFTAAVILATAATHAVFFGAGRYGIVVVPFVTAVAFHRVARPQ